MCAILSGAARRRTVESDESVASKTVESDDVARGARFVHCLHPVVKRQD
jgi:hypothetical protein